ncbi:MAG: hypothetical protein M1830_009180 [Pleopsidium flavum]|nr:MAG: hypothetical protein M1830_009180 [Pleopsidium flavum]
MSSLTRDQTAIISKTQELLGNGHHSTISDLQRLTLVDSNVKGPSWVSQVSFPAPKDDENNVSKLMYNAITALGDGGEQFEHFPVSDVEARWTGYRPNVDENEPEPLISEENKYQSMMKEVKHPTTILFFHGGAFYMNTPARYHSTTARLAELTRGRCITFRYRLAPQHPFPAALLDALVAYLSLIYPPPESIHTPVPASSIVFAGDSAGANLALALVQVILFAKNTAIQFHNQAVSLPVPGGITLLSAGLDGTLALPSWQANASFDIFDRSVKSWSYLESAFPTCSLWPSKPPRGHIYCETSMLCHPLVSPAVASSWVGAPPMWFAGGQERFADSAKVVVELASRQGVPVRYEEYAEMPHDFPIMRDNWPWATTQDWPQSVRCMAEWAKACRVFAEGGKVETGAIVVTASREENKSDIDRLTGLTFEQVKGLMREKVANWKAWTGPETGDLSL